MLARIFAALLALAVPAAAQTADVILTNANIVTLAEPGERAEAIAIAGEHIITVGGPDEAMARRGAATEVIDLGGATVVPGMIDNHVHYVRAAGGDPERFAAIARSLNAQGITAVVDAAGFRFTDALMDGVRALETRGDLTVRVFQMKWPGRHQGPAALEALRDLLAEGPDAEGLLQTVGIGEALYLPMHDNPMRAFAPTPDDVEVVEALLSMLEKTETPLHLHTRTETGTRTFLRLFGSAAPGAAARLGWTLHHLENVTPETIAMMAEVGTHAALHPRGARTGSIGGETSLRPPVGLFEDAGIVWGLGTDATGGARGLLDLVAWASGEAGNGVANTVNREAALKAVTASNAALIGRAGELGTLQEGRLADLVVLDRDVTDPASTIEDTQVLMTIVNGRIVHRDGI